MIVPIFLALLLFLYVFLSLLIYVCIYAWFLQILKIHGQKNKLQEITNNASIFEQIPELM